MEPAADKRNARRWKQTVAKQEFCDFSAAAGQLPAEIVVCQQYEYIVAAGQPGKTLVGFRSKEEESGRQRRLISDGLAGGFAAGAGQGYGFNIGDRLTDITGNGRFRVRPAKAATITPAPSHPCSFTLGKRISMILRPPYHWWAAFMEAAEI